MDTLTFNAVLRLDGHGLHGFYRVVAVPPRRWDCWLAFIGFFDDGTREANSTAAPNLGSLSQVSRATLEAMDQDGDLREVRLDSHGKSHRAAELDEKSLALWDSRQRVMEPFLNHEELCKSLVSTSGIGPLVRTAVERSACGRATVYKLWRLLCTHGFTPAALIPTFDQCGAPGIPRPMNGTRLKAGSKTLRRRLGEPEPFIQRGITEEDRVKMVLHYRRLATPKDSMRLIYDKVIEAAYVTRYVEGTSGREPVMPPQGSFPNQRQFRHAIEVQTRKIERALRRTTEGHFKRNRRGLTAPAHHGVVGPGHVYAIDSTIGDVHLRSSVNPAWIIGRPIVYLIVDIWSTAIVGFYVCLSGPSWDTAKLSLFSTFSDPRLVAELWGYKYVDVLTPSPGMPFKLLCDRGEYLSAAARGTGRLLALNLSFNPAYRPDLKGMVEVLHRIAKDVQYAFIPGAINARRKELELKANAKESVMTMRDYVKFLYSVVVEYNLFADRSHRLTTEMMAANVQPNPASLWRFGFEAGLGYRKTVPFEQLASGLLQQAEMSVRRNGLFVESLRYEGAIATDQKWTEEARNFGGSLRPAYLFPGSASRIWVPDSDGLHQFDLSRTARAMPETTLDEWRDSLMYSRLENSDREYRRLCAAATNLIKRNDIVKQARARVEAAEALDAGDKLNAREARALERLHGTAPELSVHEQTDLLSPIEPEPVNPAPCGTYEETMNAVFASMNEETSNS